MPMPKKKRSICPNCDKEVPRPEYKYCNNNCQHQFQWKQKRQQLLTEGLEIVGNESSKMKYAKRILKEKNGEKCEICGITEWQHKTVPLVLDHINGNPDDWDFKNLRLVCGNCDMQLPTFKGKNRGNGRASRRARYKQGKSY